MSDMDDWPGRPSESELYVTDREAWEKRVVGMDEGAKTAEKMVYQWAASGQERILLEALSAGHGLAEACRIAGMTYDSARFAIERIVRDHTSS